MTQNVLSLALLVGGIWAWLFVGRRRFHRRNVAGIEEFSGYGSMLITRVVEKALRILAVLMVLGSLGMMMANMNRNLAEFAPPKAAAGKAVKP